MISKGDKSIKTWKSLCCANCSAQFYFKDFTPKGSRCPILLQCGHSACESCLHQSLKDHKSITCHECNFVSLSKPDGSTTDSFPLSIYVLGNLLALQNHKLEKEKKLEFLTKSSGNFNYSYKVQPNSSSQAEACKSKCEECFLSASWFCENCRSNYCEICWSKVHRSAKSLMKHCKTAISTVEKNAIKKCPLHETQDLEFFCRSCSTAICSHCIILQHQGEGHCPITLKEKNMEILSKVKASAEVAELIQKRMKQTLEKITLTQSSLESSEKKLISDLESQIIKNFTRIHGILQLEEHRCLKQLRKKAIEREDRLKALGKQLETHISNVESLLREYEWAVKKPQCSDLTQLQGQLENVPSLPCYLISQRPEGAKDAKVTFDDGVIESLRKFCLIDVPSSEVFELRSSNDLPQGYAVGPLEPANCPEEKGSAGSPSTSDLDTLSDCSSRGFAGDLEVSSLPKEPSDPKVYAEKKNYSVRVTYIKNPEEFYVMPISQTNQLLAVEKRAAEFVSTATESPTTVAKDEVYLIKQNVNNKWCRGRVVGMSEEEAEGEKGVIVHCIDYGNTEIVPLSSIRFIPPDILEEPPLAVKCKLFDCVPKNGEWCAGSTQTMGQIVKNYKATMYVMKIHPDCLEIDLSVVYPEDQIGRDIVSVRDALLFLEFSSFVNGSKIPQNTANMRYLDQRLPSVGECFHALITHINSPSDFYVQKAKPDATYLGKLSLDLQDFYTDNLHKGVIYNPVVGMPCAALFSSDQKWYRAKIVGIHGKKMVTVLYVDYGNSETIPWNNIRKLRENFFKRPPLALHCALAGIRPTDKDWNVPTKMYMRKCILTKNCRVQVHSKPKSRSKLKVLLFTTITDKEFCINSLLVEMGYAVKSNPRSFLTAKAAQENVAEPEADRTNSQSAVKHTGERKNYCNRSKPSAKRLRELYELKKKRENRPSSEELEEEVDECDKIFKVKVKVLSCESPSCIYVTFPALLTEFDKLHQKLNEFYRDSSPKAATEWTEGKFCAVYHTLKSNWYRGSILSLLPNNHIKVFLKDIAEEITEPASNLRELDPSFTKYATCSVKCHLADIGPPGDQWPSISSEYLIGQLESYKEVYMTKKGQIEDKSLPVELWVKKVEAKGALEPTVKECVTLNKLLVSQGLAIPKEIKSWFTANFSNEEDSEGTSSAKKVCPTVAEEEEKIEKKADETPEDLDVFLPSPCPKWPPPEPLTKQKFIGVPTYVDSEGVIYIYDFEKDSDKLTEMCAYLLEEYGDSQPPPKDYLWKPGQVCIAKFHLDECWYRGLVQEVNEDMTYKILFVDYGNVETCESSDLRETAKMQDIPIITHKFKLQGLAPLSKDKQWPNSIIEIIHSLLVDKKCEVTVSRPPVDPSDIYWGCLKLDNDECEDFRLFLVEQGLALLTGEELSTSDSENSNTDYTDNFYVVTET